MTPTSINARAASLLLLLCATLMLTVGSVLQLALAHWGLMATEALLILGPALALVMARRQSLVATLQLRWPGRRRAVQAVVIGGGLALAAPLLGALVTEGIGYQPQLPPGFIPRSTTAAALLVFAFGALAPICEEALFRGVLWRAFSAALPRTALLWVAVLFAGFHMSFPRFVIILPVALVLTWCVAESGSLVTGILAHAAYNTPLALLVAIQGLRPSFDPSPPLAPLALAGIAVAGLAMWLFAREGPLPPPPAVEPAESQLACGGWRAFWPLLPVALLFVGAASAELLVGLRPELLAQGPPRFRPAPWTAAEALRYELRDPAGRPIGEAECQLTPERGEVSLVCHSQQRAFAVEARGERFAAPELAVRRTVRWSADELRITSAQESRQGEAGGLESIVRPDRSMLRLTTEGADGQPRSLYLASDALIDGEWPWRICALPLRVGHAAEVMLARLAARDPVAGGSRPRRDETFVCVKGATPLATPAGDFAAWEVSLDRRERVWCDVEPPHTMLKYDDGLVTWALSRRVVAARTRQAPSLTRRETPAPHRSSTCSGAPPARPGDARRRRRLCADSRRDRRRGSCRPARCRRSSAAQTPALPARRKRAPFLVSDR